MRVLGMSCWAVLNADSVLEASMRNGMTRLLLIAISTGETTELENSYATIVSIVRTLSPTSAVSRPNHRLCRLDVNYRGSSGYGGEYR